MKLKVENHKLVGGLNLDIDITEALLNKYLDEPISIVDIEFEVDYIVGYFMHDLNLELRYGTDDSLYTIAVLLECINGSKNVTEFDKCLSDNTPFNNSSSGFVMIVLCQLEAGGFIHDTKYRTLTEKGKVLLWLLRQFEFVETIL